jgi:hypothetical protein
MASAGITMAMEREIEARGGSEEHDKVGST